MASDPYHFGGAWTAESCQKTVRHVDLAETFHLPMLYLADCPGFLIGKEAEETGTIRHGVRAMTAINQSTMPWCAIVVRNAFGVAGGAHVPVGRFVTRYAWPSGFWGSLPLEGGIEAAYRADIAAADDPAEEAQPHPGTAGETSLAHSARQRRSGSRKSSTRAKPVACWKIGQPWLLLCGSLANAAGASGPNLVFCRSKA